MKQEDLSLELVHKSLRKSGVKVLHCADPLMPDLLALDTKKGLLSIFVFVEGNFLNTDEEVKSLKKRNRALSEEISSLLGTRFFLPLTVLQTPKKGSNRSFVIPSNLFPNDSVNALSESQFELVSERFNPKYSFIKRRRIESCRRTFGDSTGHSRAARFKSKRSGQFTGKRSFVYFWSRGKW